MITPTAVHNWTLNEHYIITNNFWNNQFFISNKYEPYSFGWRHNSIYDKLTNKIFILFRESEWLFIIFIHDPVSEMVSQNDHQLWLTFLESQSEIDISIWL